MGEQDDSGLQKDESCSIRAVRVIPFDIGHEIEDQHKEELYAKGAELLKETDHEKEIFGATALLYGKLTNSLELFLFEDGIGVLLLTEPPTAYSSFSAIDCNGILNKRRKSHSDILQHSHELSPLITNAINTFRGIFKPEKRRLTSMQSWENGGLSYVFSFYLIDAPCERLADRVLQEKLCMLLYPDDHTYGSSVSEDTSEDKLCKLNDDKDPIDDVHLAVSWATVLVLGSGIDRHLRYYSEFEVALQHIWLYAYVTEKIIDDFFLLMNRQTSSKNLSSFYETLINMTLIVDKYDSIINSGVHARDSKVFAALRDSSNLAYIVSSVKSKSDLLEKKLRWAIEMKGLSSDRIMEALLLFLAILQCVTALGFTFDNISETWWATPLMLLIVIAVLLLRLRR